MGSYAYDKAGNVTQQTVGGVNTNFGYDGDLMTAKGGNALDWDADGRMISGINRSLTYNWDSKLRSATSGTTTVALRYDPDGNRVLRTVNTTTNRKYIIDMATGLPTILLEIDPAVEDPNQAITKTYLYANSQIIAQHDGYYGDAMYFYLHDRLGSVREVINTNAEVRNTYTYEPFGTAYPTEVQSNVSNPWQFTGQYFDSEFGQYFLRARQYDLAIYRFTARDPYEGSFEEPLELHRYLYCLNDGINKFDPSGRNGAGSITETEVAATEGAAVDAGVGGGLNYAAIVKNCKLVRSLFNLRNSMMAMLPEAVQGDMNKYVRFMNQLGYQVHHIVARGWGVMSRFGADVIDSIDNVVMLRPEMHAQITRFFNSGVRKLDFLEDFGVTKGTLQKYVASLPLDKQAQWGAAVIQHLYEYGSMIGFEPARYGLMP
jgi:RHS repeat-associated protein